ncbi:drf_FH3 domain-containing protein [Trichonephila clavipes]|nr:drf_FH3 domain-containing protein [Trichonephila clavipes]
MISSQCHFCLGDAKIEYFEMTVTLIFLNTMLDQCSKLSDRVRIQSELEEAGLDVDFLEKQLRQKFGNSTHRIWNEIQKWRELQIDLQDSLQKQQENMKLRKEVSET